jgi:hypothetical protein
MAAFGALCTIAMQIFRHYWLLIFIDIFDFHWYSPFSCYCVSLLIDAAPSQAARPQSAK